MDRVVLLASLLHTDDQQHAETLLHTWGAAMWHSTNIHPGVRLPEVRGFERKSVKEASEAL